MHIGTPRLLALSTAFATGCVFGTSQLGDPTSGSSESTGDATSGAASTSDPSLSSTTTSTASDVTTDPPDEDSSGGVRLDVAGPDSASSDDGTTAGGGALGEPCDVWAQDCAPGLKCAAWIDDGGDAWNATRCVEVVDDPQDVGAPCTAEVGATGNDDCGFAAMCFHLDEVNEGTCHALCGGTAADPQCAQGTTCVIANDGVLTLCLDTCDPVTPQCAEGLGCYPFDEQFVCLTTYDDSDYLEDCTIIATCNPGNACIDGEAVTGCEFDGCCTPFCDLDTPDTCPAESIGCVPYYPEGEAPEGFETVGFCG
jgi:hypothetical protein